VSKSYKTHIKKPSAISPHPTASSVFAICGCSTAGSNVVLFLALNDDDADANCTECCNPLTTTGKPLSVEWSDDGKHALVITDDSSVIVYDPRSGATKCTIPCAHKGKNRPITALWLQGMDDRVATAGTGMMRDREFVIWDVSNPEGRKVHKERLDSNSGLMKLDWDGDLNLLLVNTRGGTTSLAYECGRGGVFPIKAFNLGGEVRFG